MGARHQRRLRDNLAGWLFISPSVLVIGAFGILPVFFTVYVSLHRRRLARVGFSGLGNYATLFGDSLLPLGLVAASIAGVAAAGALLRRAGPRAGFPAGPRAARDRPAPRVHLRFHHFPAGPRVAGRQGRFQFASRDHLVLHRHRAGTDRRRASPRRASHAVHEGEAGISGHLPGG